MTLRYQVFIQGAQAPDPSALSRVAGAIAARYGLPPDDLARRMAAGRFRVKSGIDLATAERLADDLESLGAVCVIEDETGQAVARPGAEPEPAPAAAAAQDSMQSGLAAAFAADGAAQDLGVLSDVSASFTLATLDGEEDHPPPPQEYDADAYSPAHFAPPDAGGEQNLQLAVDVNQPSAPAASHGTDPSHGVDSDYDAEATIPAVSFSPSPAVAVPRPEGHSEVMFDEPAPRAPKGSPAPARASAQQQAVPAAGKENPIEKVRGLIAGSERARFAVGVFAALLIGFLPVHIFASVRESSAYTEIDAEVRAEQARVSDIDEWNALDEIRDAQLDRKQSRQTSIALSGMFIWALVGGGLAFLWFRKIDWDRYRSP